MTDTELEFVKNFIAEHPDYIKKVQAVEQERKEYLDPAATKGHGKTYSFVIKD